MKLGTFVFAVSAVVAATGCASQPSPSTTAVPTSTTRITAAEVPVADDAPRVGKQQNASAVSNDLSNDLSNDEEKAPAKDGRGHRRAPGGGFSGYKY